MAELHVEVAEPLPGGWTMVEAIVLAKCLDEDGQVVLWQGASGELKAWESLGMLLAAADHERDGIRHGWEED